MENIAHKTKSSLIWSTALRIGYQIIRFAVSIIIARLLEPKDFGIMGIATMIVFYANTITNFGFNNALIQKKDINDEHVNSVFTIDVIVSIILFAVTILLSHRIAVFFHIPELEEVLWAVSPIFIITSFFQMPMTLMKRHVNFKITSITEFLQGIIQSFLTLALAFWGFKYWSLVIGLVVSYTVSTLFILLVVKWKPKIKYSNIAVKSIFNFGMYNLLRAQLFYINSFADKFIIGKFLGPTFLGFYEKAYSTAEIQRNCIGMPINAVMFSSFSRIQSVKDDQIKKYFKKALSIILLISIPFNVVLFLLGAHFVSVLLGSKWELMIRSLKIFSVAFVFVPVNGLLASLNIGIGNYKRQTINECICSVFLIIVCLLIVQNGIEYVAFGFLFASFLQFILAIRLAKESLKLRGKDVLESLRPAILGSVFMAIMIILSEKWFFYKINAVNFILLLAIGCFSYILAILSPNYRILEDFRKPIIDNICFLINKIYAFFYK
ncbi:MAG: lipopolysaccharide biosynthesis protein [Candidatus Scalindua sp.]|nr:lipopolysaccharide biosynthesis protein [Candidatus Scalindua sp.]